VTSLLGLGALIAGLVMLIAASETGFAVLTAVLLVLWVITTVCTMSFSRGTCRQRLTSARNRCAHTPRPPGERAYRHGLSAG
jgi:multisubunit Na+/H+ antiporter MnhG subunit